MAARRRIAVFLFALALTAPFLSAQSGTEPKPDTQADESAARPVQDFFYLIDSSGAPVFRQVLHWEADPNALEYRLVVTDSSGVDIIDERASEPRKEVRLEPGSYTYRIVTYNLLGKAEAETERIALTIIKAEQPVIRSTSPKTIFMDTLDGRVTIVGEKLVDACAVTIVGAKGKRYRGSVIERSGDQKVVVVFPDEAYESGEYALNAENPGGLSAAVEGALLIRFQRPVDFLVSAGYAPFTALNDEWVVGSWLSNFHPAGFDARIELFFVKQRWGMLGMGVGAEYRRMSAVYDGAALTSDFVLAGADFMYKYRFTRQLHGVARAGGGISRSGHLFEYEGFVGPSTTSYDPFARAGLAFQAFLPWKIYGEIGVSGSCVFLLNHYAFGITPKLSVGYQLY